MDAKPCPFCGSEAITLPRRDGINAECPNTDCTLYQGLTVPEWNTRPIEDALRADLSAVTAERDALRRQLENVDREIDDVR